MTLSQLPTPSPLHQAAARGLSPFELASAAVAARRGWSGPLGMTMTSGPGETEPPSGGGDGGDGDDDAGEVTIDGKVHKIKDLQRIMADEKRQGRRSGERKTLEDLGVESADEAKRLITEARRRQQESESEAERKAREADERTKAADKREAEAAAKARRADLRGELRDHNVAREDLDDAMTLLDPAVGDDYDDAALTDAVTKLKERRPGLFGGAGGGQGGGNGGPGGAGGFPPGGPGQRPDPNHGKAFGAGGKARAERRFGKTGS